MSYLQSGGDYLVSNAEVVRWEAIITKVKGYHVREDSCHGVITEGVYTTDVKVAQEAGGYCIPPTARGSHG